jgi:NDP-sugar pyrophosphorylase family protein
LRRLPDFRAARAAALPALPVRPALRAIVLLSGTVGTGGLAGAARRPALTLPVDGAGRRLLDCWLDAMQQFVEADDVHALPVRVLTNALPELLGTLPADNGVLVRVETDPSELRGTAGLLRDAAAAYDDDQFILMINAAQLPIRPLAQAVGELSRAEADVAFYADDAAHAGSMMLIRCACLRAIPDVGFVDLKEQALAQIARRHRVSVLKQRGAPVMPMRTAAEYVAALRWLHRDPAQVGAADGAFVEDWAPRFSIREQRSTVHGTARLHDSVVLDGGTVHRGAVLVRSVVCAGGVVPARATVVDAVVTARK